MAARKPQVFPHRTLRRVAREHVSYELRMMAYLGGAKIAGVADPALGYSQLEAWLLHVRNLHEFLTTTRQGRDAKGWRNVVAEDYMPSTWTAPSKCLTKQKRRRIDQALAHISAGRRMNTTWDRVALTSTVLHVFRRRFYEPFVVLHPRRREWFALDDASAIARRAEQGHHVVAQLHRVGNEFKFVLR